MRGGAHDVTGGFDGGGVSVDIGAYVALVGSDNVDICG